MEKFRIVKPEINKDLCVKCGFCELYCPEGCILKNGEGYYYIFYEYCKGCGICAKQCNSDSVKMVDDKE